MRRRAANEGRPFRARVGGAALVLLASLVLPTALLAQAVPTNLRAAIFIRALGYERGFTSGRGTARLLVVGASSGASARDASGMISALREIVSANPPSRPLRIERLTHSSDAETARRIKSADPAAVYLPPSLVDVARELRGERGLIVLCGSAERMDLGCAVSVEVAGRSPRIVIHLGRAEQAGLRFDARLLRLSRVIR